MFVAWFGEDHEMGDTFDCVMANMKSKERTQAVLEKPSLYQEVITMTHES